MSEPGEFSRPYRLRALPPGGVTIAASEAECAALAERFGVTAIPGLACTATLTRKGDTVRARGTVAADVTQPCAVSFEDFTYRVAEAFDLAFIPATPPPPSDAEIELTADDLDEIEYEGDTIDLGEAAAQTLALAIDPYREGPSAAAARQTAGIVSDEDAAPTGPLAEALAALKGGGG